MTKAVTIRIKLETHERLKTFGTLGDTFDSLINKALDCLERERETEAMVGRWHHCEKSLQTRVIKRGAMKGKRRLISRFNVNL